MRLFATVPQEQALYKQLTAQDKKQKLQGQTSASWVLDEDTPRSTRAHQQAVLHGTAVLHDAKHCCWPGAVNPAEHRSI